MKVYNFIKKLRKIYNVWEIYYAPKDLYEFWFHLENATVCLCYSGQTLRESTHKDMLRRIEDDLKFYEEDK